eukprot:scaffold3402_cov169-Amphora_coffeaeformis.AAC.6
MGSSNGASVFGEGSESMESAGSLSEVCAFQFDGLSIPVFAVDATGCIIHWNRCLAEVTGITSVFPSNGSRTSVPATSLLTTSSANAWETALQTTLSKGNAKCCIEIKCAEGITKSFVANLATQTATSVGGETMGVVCFLEEATMVVGPLFPSEISLQSLEMPIIGVDLELNICLWNESITLLSNVEKSETWGKNVVDFVMPTSRQSLERAIFDAVQGQSSMGLEIRLPTESGEWRTLLANVVPWRPPHNSSTVVGALVMGQDVTQAAATAIELRELLDTANASIFGVDCDGKVNEWNQFMTETTGYSADEVFHTNFIDTFIHMSRRNVTESIIECALKGRGMINVDMELKSKFGEVRSLLLSASARRNVHNEIVGAIFVAQDTTERANHDRAVAAMASELRQLIDTANAPIFGIDCDGDVNEWNDKTAEITGYTKEEAFDCSLVDTFIVPHMQASVRDVFENAKQGRGTSNYELEFRTKSNEIRHLLVNATTRRDAENNVVGVVAVAQDVTEAVQRDRAVAGMALELRQLIDTANAPIFGIDIDGNVNEWNRRTQEITGYSKEETFDEPLVERFIAPSMRQKVQEILDDALCGNETSNYELEFVAKSGEPRFMLVNATTRRDPEFNVVGVVGVAQDVTEDRKHADELSKWMTMNVLLL